MPPPLDHAEAVAPDIGILRRIGDEAFRSQSGRVTVVIIRVALRLDGIPRRALQSMLAYYNGTLLAGLDVLRDQQNSIRENAGPHVQRHFVAAILRLVVDLPRSRIGWNVRRRHAADHFGPDVITMCLSALL